MYSTVLYATFALGFITQVLLIRVSSIELYSLYVILAAIIAIVKVTLLTKTSELFLRSSTSDSGYKQYKTYLVSIDFILLSISGFLISIILYFSNYELNVLSLIILILIFPASSGFNINKNKFILFNSMDDLTIMEFLIGLMRLAVLPYAASYDQLSILLAGVLFLRVSENVLSMIMTSKFTLKNDTNINVAYDKKTASYSLLRTFSKQSFSESEVILLSLFASAKEIVLYKIAKTLAHITTVIQQPIWRRLQPKIYKSSKTNNESINRIVRSGIVLSLFTSSPIIIIFSLFGEKLISMLYGEQFIDAYFVCLILIVGKIIFATNLGWYKIWSINTSFSWFTPIPYIAGLISMLVLAFILKPESAYIFSIISLFSYVVAIAISFYGLLALKK